MRKMQKIFSKKVIKAAVFLVFIFSFTFLSFRGFFKGFKNTGASLLFPAQKVFYQTSKRITDYTRAVFSFNDILKENFVLKEQVDKLQVDLSKLSEIKRENEALRESLKLAPKDEFDFVFANVIGYDPVNFGQYLFVDRGSSAGISNGQAVITTEGIVVGKIFEVQDNTAKAQLLSDSNCSINVISQETRSTGILKGTGADNLIIEMIPQDSAITAGENIITSGLGGVLPKGFLVGVVERVISSDVDAYKSARVKPLADIYELSAVLIIKGFKN
jgi:rod shape-determining protein MreC